ncbi:hypothetical protein FQN54_003498 [Arachnomyces sp. PD_36]|nr:hypothetical protein FQN54_003498 [Arachnomyces sp. PD_36]
MSTGHCSRYIPYQSWRLHTLRRLFLSSKDSNRLSSPSRSFTNGPELLFTRSPQATSTAQDATRTSVARSPQGTGEEDTIGSTTTVSRSRLLPQSPFLNPGNEDEPPVKKRKRQPTKEDKDRLRHNAWAMALSSSVRLCAATGARLPTECLLDWGLVRHHEAKNLWFIPKSLFVDELMEATNSDEQTKMSAGDDANGEGDNVSGSTSTRRPKGDIRTITHARKFYLLNRAGLHKDLSSSPRSRDQNVARLVPQRWKGNFGGNLMKGDLKSLVWRDDMPEFVLGGLRKEAVKALKKACLIGMKVEDAGGVWRVVGINGDVINEETLSGGLERIGELEGMASGGVLVFGSDTMRDGNSGKETGGMCNPPQPGSDCSLPDLITLPIQGSQVPVFDLRALLSESDIDQLRSHHPRFRETALFFRPGGNIPAEAMLALWKLQGCVMHDRNF